MFENLAVSDQTVLNATGETEAERLRGAVVTANCFDVLGVKAQLGRTLQPSDDQAVVIAISFGNVASMRILPSWVKH